MVLVFCFCFYFWHQYFHLYSKYRYRPSRLLIISIGITIVFSACRWPSFVTVRIISRWEFLSFHVQEKQDLVTFHVIVTQQWSHDSQASSIIQLVKTDVISRVFLMLMKPKEHLVLNRLKGIPRSGLDGRICCGPSDSELCFWYLIRKETFSSCLFVSLASSTKFNCFFFIDF